MDCFVSPNAADSLDGREVSVGVESGSGAGKTAQQHVPSCKDVQQRCLAASAVASASVLAVQSGRLQGRGLLARAAPGRRTRAPACAGPSWSRRTGRMAWWESSPSGGRARCVRPRMQTISDADSSGGRCRAWAWGGAAGCTNNCSSNGRRQGCSPGAGVPALLGVLGRLSGGCVGTCR